MQEQAIIPLIEQLIHALEAAERKEKPVVRLGATEGLMQQVHIKSNKTGAQQLTLEQLYLLKEIYEKQRPTIHKELGEEYADKVMTIDVRQDIDELLEWEKPKRETFVQKMSYWMYSLIIVFLLVCVIVGLKSIFEFILSLV